MKGSNRTSRMTGRLWTLGVVLLAALPALAGGAAGDIDAGFGNAGVSLLANPGGYAPSVARQSTGDLVLGGTENGPNVDGTTRAHWRITRLNDDGSLDTSFGAGGEVQLFGEHSTDALRHLVTDSSDRILCAGDAVIETETTSGRGKKQKTTVSQVNRLIVVRLLADGALDTAFGDGGIAVIEVSEAQGGHAQAQALHLLASSGDILVAGDAFRVAGASSGGGGRGKKGGGGSTTTSDAHVLLRLTSSGVLDSTFGDGGITVHDATTGDDEVWAGAIGVQSSGRIVLGALARDLGEQWTLVAFDADGAVDATFGRVVVSGAYLRGFAIDASDRILGCGYTVDTPGIPAFVLTRHASDGTIDASFGTSGSATLGLTENSEGSQVLVQADGKIVAAVNILDAGTIARCQPVRFTSLGAIDVSFGPAGAGDAIDEASVNNGLGVGALIDANGDIVMTGFRFTSSIQDWLIARWCGS